VRPSLQDQYAPNGKCFRCGPRNTKGLRLKTFPNDDGIVADWKPEPEHVSFGRFGSGGIISVLLDCSGNWASAYALMKGGGLSSPPGTVTAEYTVKFLKPTPVDQIWNVVARATKINGSRVKASGELKTSGEVTATMKGLFVAVSQTHPAFRRWK
jgi:acyl-coenzyme A thioesterase PaaI-like protein